MKFLKSIFTIPLVKLFSLNGISVCIKIAIGLITSKMLALFVGPSGMALVGNFRNFFSSVESVASLGFQNGIVKYVVESKDNRNDLRKIISTISISLLSVSIILSCLIYIFSDDLNTYIFSTSYQYSLVFKGLALALPWYAMSIFLIAVINGLEKFNKVIYINIIGNALGLLVSVGMIWRYNTFGALLSVVISPALLFFVTLYLIAKEINLTEMIRLRFFDFEIIKKMSSYSMMALVSAVLGPFVFLAIRRTIIESVGIDQAGYWETMSRISSYYFMFISTLLSVYFFPKLTLAKDKLETKKIFWTYYKGIMPLFLIGLSLVFILKTWLIRILFTKDFLDVSTLFLWQLIGDFFKAGSLILGYQFFAKKLTKAFIVTEVFSLFTLYALSLYCLNVFGLQGVVIAHALTYLIYWIVLSVYFRKDLFC